MTRRWLGRVQSFFARPAASTAGTDAALHPDPVTRGMPRSSAALERPGTVTRPAQPAAPESGLLDFPRWMGRQLHRT